MSNSSRRLTSKFSLVSICGVIAKSNSAYACAVCGAGNTDKIQKVLLFSTGILSLAPLIVIGGICFYIYRRSLSEKK